MNKKSSKTIFLAITACILWSTAFAGIKIGLKYSSPLYFAGLRFVLAGIILLPFTGKIKKIFWAVKTDYSIIVKVAFYYTFLLYSLFYIGIYLGSASITAMIVGSSPLFTVILANYFMPDDKFTKRKIVLVLTGMIGIVIIVIGRYELVSIRGKEFWAVFLLIISNLAGSYGNILVAKNKSSISTLTLNSLQLIVGGIMLLVASHFFEKKLNIEKSFEYYGALLYLTLISAVAISIWFSLLSKPGVKVSELNMWKFIIPVGGAVISWIILPDEKADFISIIGMIFIAASLIIIHINKNGDLKNK